MTGTNSVIDVPSPSSSQSLQDGISITNTGTRSSQHSNTARSKRFSQKLIDAARKSSFARNPLLSPSTSSSLSPPPGIYLDDDALTDISSCISTPQRNENELHRNLRHLILSPLHMDLPNDTSMSSSTYSTEISSYDNAIRKVDTPETRRDKRPETQQHITDSPSLSAKPKRRKLKQQKTTSWRMGADATLDTTTVYDLPEASQQHNENSRRHDDQQAYRRSTRIAKQRATMKLNSSKYATPTQSSNKHLPLTLGTPCGVKSSSTGSTQRHDAVSYTGGDDDDDDDDIHSIASSSNNSQIQCQQQRDRVDVVENRLTQLMYTYDTLDLSRYSIVPQTAAPPPVVIVLDDDDDNNSQDDTNDKRTHNSQSNTNGNYVDLTLSSPPSPTLQPTTPTLDESQLPSSNTGAHETNQVQNGPAMVEMDDGTESATIPNATSAVDVIHALEDTTQGGDLILANDWVPPGPNSNGMDSMPVNTSPTLSTTLINAPTTDGDGDDDDSATDIGTFGSTDSNEMVSSSSVATTPLPTTCFSTPDTLTTTIETPSPNYPSEDDPAATTFSQTTELDSPIPEETAGHQPSLQAKCMYALLAGNGSLEMADNVAGLQQGVSAATTKDSNDQMNNKENMATIIPSSTTTSSISSSSSDTQQQQHASPHLQEYLSSSTTTTDANSLEEQSVLKRVLGSMSHYLLGN